MNNFSCNDQSLQSILIIVKRILLLVQIVVPILLIIYGTISFIKMVKNPDEKSGMKKIYNQFLGAAIVFFVPLSINVVMGMIGERTNFSSCWNDVDNTITWNYQYYDNKNKRKKPLSDSSQYEKGKEKKQESTSSVGFDSEGSWIIDEIPSNVTGIAQLAVQMAGTATLRGEDAHIYSPTANPWCKVRDTRLYNEYRIMDETITNYPNSCPNPNNLLCFGEGQYSYNNPAYASCAQAAAAVIRGSVDPDFESFNPEYQLRYLKKNTEKWALVRIVKAGEKLDAVCQPGDLMVTMSGLTHTMIYVGNAEVRKKFPDSIGNVYQAGYSQGHARYPSIDYMDSAYAQFYVFRPTGRGTFTYPFININEVLRKEINWNNNQGVCGG